MFERCLYFNVNALARTVNRIWEQAFAELDLSPSHAYLLRLVLSEPGMAPGRIAAELRLDKSTVSRFLNVLENKGYIVRRAGCGDDGRGQAVFPTRKSERIAQQLARTGDRLYSKMTQALGKQNLVALVGELRKSDSKLD